MSSQYPTHDISCPVCGNQSFRRLTKYRGNREIFIDLEILRCSECTLAFATPLPSDEQLAAYNASYWQSAHGGLPTDLTVTKFHSGINQLRVRYVQAYIEEQKRAVASVLEIGPGHGYFCAHLRSRFSGVEYAVVETDRSCHARLHELVHLGVNNPIVRH